MNPTPPADVPARHFWNRLFDAVATVPVLAALIVLLVFAVQLGQVFETRDLWLTEETRQAAVLEESQGQADRLVPTLEGEPYLEHPPGWFWAVDGLERLMERVSPDGAFDMSSALRVGAVLSALLLVLATALLARAVLGDRRRALGAVVVLMACLAFTGLAQYTRMDVLFAALVGFSLAGLYSGLSRPRANIRTVLGFVCAGLAALVNGPLGILLPFAVMLIWLLICLRPGRLNKADALIGFLLMLALPAAWIVALLVTDRVALVETLFLERMLGQVLTASPDARPWWFYLALLPLAWLPWILLIPVAPLSALRSTAKTADAERPARGLFSRRKSIAVEAEGENPAASNVAGTAAADTIAAHTAGNAADVRDGGLSVNRLAGTGGRFLFCALLCCLVLLSLISVKRGTSLIVLFPVLAAVSSAALFCFEGRALCWFGRLYGLFLLLLGLALLLAATWPLPGLPGEYLAPYAAEIPGEFFLFLERAQGLGMLAAAALLAGILLLGTARRNSTAGVLILSLCLAAATGCILTGTVVPSLNGLMSTRYQAEHLGQLVERGYLPAVYQLPANRYSYYAGVAPEELASAEALSGFMAARDGKGVVLVLRARDWESWNRRPAALRAVQRQWIVDGEYVLAVCPPDERGSTPRFASYYEQPASSSEAPDAGTEPDEASLAPKPGLNDALKNDAEGE